MENEIFLSLPYSNYQAESIHPSHYGHTWIITNKGDLIEAYNSTDRKTLRAYNFFDKTIYPKAKYITYWKIIKTIYGFFHKQESIN